MKRLVGGGTPTKGEKNNEIMSSLRSARGGEAVCVSFYFYNEHFGWWRNTNQRRKGKNLPMNQTARITQNRCYWQFFSIVVVVALHNVPFHHFRTNFLRQFPPLFLPDKVFE
jgi:hypothetical protein